MSASCVGTCSNCGVKRFWLSDTMSLQLDDGRLECLPHPSEGGACEDQGLTLAQASHRGRLYRETFYVCRHCGREGETIRKQVVDDRDMMLSVRGAMKWGWTLAETIERVPMRVCGYCLMPNHWHLALWPDGDGDLARFMQRLTITHVRRWLEHRRRVGMGSVYQGRYKSFPVEDDSHFTTLIRYLERNPLRAGLVRRAERWPWSSLSATPKADVPPIAISRWPVARRADWVNAPQTPAEEEAVRRSIAHSRPFGSPGWVRSMEKRLDLPPLRPRGRPRKNPDDER